jgi:hypothetical protein
VIFPTAPTVENPVLAHVFGMSYVGTIDDDGRFVYYCPLLEQECSTLIYTVFQDRRKVAR